MWVFHLGIMIIVAAQANNPLRYYVRVTLLSEDAVYDLTAEM